MKADNYNGWYNYETWATNLWYTNESDVIADLHDMQHSFRAKDASEIATWLKEQIEASIEDAGVSNGLISDLLTAATSEINYYEIAEHWIENWKENYPEDFDDDDDAQEETTS